MLWLLLQIRQWWLPYLFGPTFLHENFAWYFQHGYAETIKVLAVAEGRPTPDLQHNVLQVTLAWSGADLVVKGARSIKELKELCNGLEIFPSSSWAWL